MSPTALPPAPPAGRKSTMGTNIPPQNATADSVETRLGTFTYLDGAPTRETVEKVYDHLDLMHGIESFVNAYQGASTSAIMKGLNDAGVPNNTAIIFSELMDSKSVFLPANADVVYFLSVFDVSDGPIVVETPPMALGVIDDMWTMRDRRNNPRDNAGQTK
jgi:hypothetical protein